MVDIAHLQKQTKQTSLYQFHARQLNHYVTDAGNSTTSSKPIFIQFIDNDCYFGHMYNFSACMSSLKILQMLSVRPKTHISRCNCTNAFIQITAHGLYIVTTDANGGKNRGKLKSAKTAIITNTVKTQLFCGH